MRGVGVVLLLAYPTLLYFGLTRWSARTLGWVLSSALLVAAFARVRGVPREQLLGVVGPFVPMLALVVLASLADDRRAILALPVAVNLALLVPFASSLRAGRVPMVQRFAEIERGRRMPGSRLSPGAIGHCRRVTAVWCGFFVFNGAVAAVLACFAPVTWWLAYTCFLSYLLMAAIFLGERVARRAVARRGPGLVSGTSERSVE